MHPAATLRAPGRPLTLLVLLLIAAACEPRGTGGGKLRVVASVSPITNLVDNIGSDEITLTGIVPEGQNSHEFELPPEAVRAVAEADLVFINGLHLETPVTELVHRTQGGPVLIELANTVEEQELIFDFSYPREKGDPNPHLWTNPLYAKRFALRIAEELSRARPSIRTEARTARLIEKIEALDAAVREATSTTPASNRRLLTYHDSFPYFAREYGWEVLGAIQPSDFSEPTARDIARLIDQIREEELPAVFGSEVFSSRVLERIAKESGARYVADLRDDDLPGERGDPEHSYMGLMRLDFVTIVRALGGDPSALERLDVSNLSRERATYAR